MMDLKPALALPKGLLLVGLELQSLCCASEFFMLYESFMGSIDPSNSSM